MAEMAADAFGLMEIAGWSTCRVVGISVGGMVAQEFAVTSPERVGRLALACTSPGGEGGSSYPLEKLLELPPDEQTAATLKLADSRWDERWLDDHPADRALAERLASNQVDPKSAAARTAQLDARHGYEGGHGFLFQDPAAMPAIVEFLQASSG